MKCEHAILSLFPGIDLLGRAFEASGFCIMRGPDPLWAGDIRRYHVPPDILWGVIAGSPCQDFSAARRAAPTGYGREMIAQFKRIVREASPEWWLLENVPRVPDVRIRGYSWQRLDLEQARFSGVSGLRHIQFGSRSTATLEVSAGSRINGAEPRAMASDGRSFREVCELQGLPDDFDLPPFLEREKIRAVGNGVPWCLGRALACAVASAYGIDGGLPSTMEVSAVKRRRCACGCGREVRGRAKSAGPACRKRLQRRREASSLVTS